MIVKGHVEVMCKNCGYKQEYLTGGKIKCPKCNNTSGLIVRSIDGKPLKHLSMIEPRIVKVRGRD